MLALTCDARGLEDGMEMLDLGCGWGSLSFWLAERYPALAILAVSNSRLQREFIEASAPRGVTNVEVVTADANVFDTGAPLRPRRLGRDVRAHAQLRGAARRVASLARAGRQALRPRLLPPRASRTVRRGAGWRGSSSPRALMPSHDLLLELPARSRLERRWAVGGAHYARTAEAWIANMDRAGGRAARGALGGTTGPAGSGPGSTNWRVFFLACAELWGYRGGREWGVSHYLLSGTGAG